MRERGLKAVVATGSVFEPDEGAGAEPRRAFSPYGLSKGLTWQVDPILVRDARRSRLASSSSPIRSVPRRSRASCAYVVDALGEGRGRRGANAALSARQHPCRSAGARLTRGLSPRAGEVGAGRRFGPCGYLETQGAFAERLARELAPRLGLRGPRRAGRADGFFRAARARQSQRQSTPLTTVGARPRRGMRWRIL